MSTREDLRSYLLCTSMGATLGLTIGGTIPFVIDNAIRLNDFAGIVFLLLSIPGGTAIGAWAGSKQYGKNHHTTRAFHHRSVILAILAAVASYGAWILIPIHPLFRLPLALLVIPLVLSIQFAIIKGKH